MKRRIPSNKNFFFRIILILVHTKSSSCENILFYDIDEALNAAKVADLERAFEIFHKVLKAKDESRTIRARALHGLASLTLIINADADHAAKLYVSAKDEDATAIPPLAELQMEGESCLGLADIYWTTAFAVKRLSVDPTTAFDVHISLGILLEDSGARESAIMHFRKALTLVPNDTSLLFREALTVPAVLSHDNASFERSALDFRINSLLTDAPHLSKLQRLDQLSCPGTFYVVYLGGRTDARLMTSIHNAYAIVYPGLRANYLQKRKIEKRSVLHIGFVSSYLTRHSVCKLFCGIARGLSDLGFRITLYSAAEKEDDWTAYVTASNNTEKVRLEKGALISNRNLIKDVDALVFTDLGMDTRTSVWAAARLAPVQILTWGHPHTSGMANTVDYFISSDIYEADSHHSSLGRYSEQLVLFDSLGFFFRHPDDANYGDRGRTNSDDDKFELQLQGPIILCPQSLQKFHPSFDAAIVGIIESIPTATILITYDTKKTLLLRTLRKRLDPKLGNHTSRFVAIPLVRGRKFFSLLRFATLLLDPYPFGGGVTTLEAFSVCKAVVTAPSLQTVPTLAAGMYRHMVLSVTAPIVNDQDDYIRTVIRLVKDDEERHALERAICDTRHKPKQSIFSSQLAVHEWATFLRRAIDAATKHHFSL